MHSGISDTALQVRARNLALLSLALRHTTADMDTATKLRLHDADFVLRQVASYRHGTGAALADLDLVEYSLRTRGGADFPSRQSSMPTELTVSGDQVSGAASAPATAYAGDVFARGRLALAQGDYQRAVTLFRGAGATAPGTEQAQKQQKYWLALALYQSGSARGDAQELAAASAALADFQPDSAPGVAAGDPLGGVGATEAVGATDASAYPLELRERIRVELFFLGDPNALSSLGALSSALAGSPAGTHTTLADSLVLSSASLELRRIVLFVLAARGGAGAARVLRSIAEGRRDASSALQVDAIHALSARKLADQGYLARLSSQIRDAERRRVIEAAVAIVGEYAQTGVVAGAEPGAPREATLVVAHDEPKLQMRTAVSAAQLGGVQVAAILTDGLGNVYTGDSRTRRLVVFDSAGNRTLSMGPHGLSTTGNDGSFGTIDAMAWLGDTIVVADNSRGELSFLSRSGELLAQRNWPPGLGVVAGLYASRSALYAAGAAGAAGGSGGARRTYFRVSARGMQDVRLQLRDTVFAATQLECRDEVRGIMRTVAAPFASHAAAALRAFDGDGHLVVAMRESVVRDSLLFELRDATSGGVALRVSLPFEKLPLSDDRWLAESQAVQRMFGAVEGVRCNPPLVRPATEPAVTALVADERGRWWVETNGAFGSQLLIVDLVLGTFETTAMPPRVEAVAPAVRGNRMLVLTLDAAGRAMIAAYHKRY
jgi:hypothetical protein